MEKILKDYTVLIQTSDTTFDIKTYTATSKFRTYAKYRQYGMAISILPQNEENVDYQYKLKFQLENNLL